jgi:IS1 family transposase
LKTEALWIFGGICRENNECFIERVKRRDEKTLIPVLQRYVDKDSVIMSDHWPVYTNLAKNFGYLENHIVIHQYHYLQPDDNSIHTQKVERMWLSVRNTVKSFKPPAIDL